MDEIINSLKAHIKNAYESLNPKSFRQEPAYVSALMGRLVGGPWEDEYGNFIKISSTVVDDHGRNTAEKITGADFAIVFHRENSDEDLKKGVIGQAKKGELEQLTSKEINRLSDQCEYSHKNRHAFSP